MKIPGVHQETFIRSPRRRRRFDNNRAQWIMIGKSPVRLLPSAMPPLSKCPDTYQAIFGIRNAAGDFPCSSTSTTRHACTYVCGPCDSAMGMQRWHWLCSCKHGC